MGTRFVGKDLAITHDGTDLSGDFTEFEYESTQNLTEATAGSDAAATYLKTYTDGTGTLTMYRDKATNTKLVTEGDEGNLIWGPEGSTSGNPRYTVNAIVSNYRERYPFDDKVEVTVNFQFSGAITEDTYP